MDANDLLDLQVTLTAHKGWRRSTIGAYAVNDGAFFARIAKGGDCSTRTFNKVLAWFADNWPEDLEWPAHIARPAPAKRGHVA